jgi:hypothetical protein
MLVTNFMIIKITDGLQLQQMQEEDVFLMPFWTPKKLQFIQMLIMEVKLID